MCRLHFQSREIGSVTCLFWLPLLENREFRTVMWLSSVPFHLCSENPEYSEQWMEQLARVMPLHNPRTCILWERDWREIWIWSDEFEFGVRNLNLKWGIWIWSEEFEFGVRNLNLEWGIWIWSEEFEFGMRNLNLEWEIWIWSEVFEFGVRNLNLEWGIWIWSYEI
jgi:hypothetical protein